MFLILQSFYWSKLKTIRHRISLQLQVFHGSEALHFGSPYFIIQLENGPQVKSEVNKFTKMGFDLRSFPIIYTIVGHVIPARSRTITIFAYFFNLSDAEICMELVPTISAEVFIYIFSIFIGFQNQIHPHLSTFNFPKISKDAKTPIISINIILVNNKYFVTIKCNTVTIFSWY